jgi:hypothetical protein
MCTNTNVCLSFYLQNVYGNVLRALWLKCLSVCPSVTIWEMQITRSWQVRFWWTLFWFCSFTPGLPSTKRWSRNSLTFKVKFKVLLLEKYKHADNSNKTGPIWTVSFSICAPSQELLSMTAKFINIEGQFQGHRPGKYKTSDSSKQMVWHEQSPLLTCAASQGLPSRERCMTTKFIDLRGHFQGHMLGKVQKC